MSNLSEILPKEWQNRTDSALQWVRRSISVTGGQGSAHSWHCFLGWSKAYPETTGYLIETLLLYAELNQDTSLRSLALKQAKWLDTIQLSSGAFPGLLAGNTRPSVFNTSQILFAAPYLKASERAVAWLRSVLEANGSWLQAAYVPGFVPTYYTRALWGVLRANETLQNPETEDWVRQALKFYSERFLPNGGLRDAGFRDGKAAFTHTIAYALEGFWECALQLNQPRVLDQVMQCVIRLLGEREKAFGRTAGRYDENWQGDYSFICITGNFQLSVLCHKIWLHTGQSAFRFAADSFLFEVLKFQKGGPNKNTFGAFSGSTPLWGAYLPFRYPNWTVKFFLDAMYYYKPTFANP